MLTFERDKDRLRVLLAGEIDHCAAEGMRARIEQQLTDLSIRELWLDFSQVTFMDSSGIGMVIGRYKTMAARGGAVFACGLHPPVDRLFRMAGLHRIIRETAEGGRDER